MEELMAFIQKQNFCFLATVENGNQARVRPMNALVTVHGKLAWCTNNQKEMFKQVAACPDVEVCLFESGTTVRITGRCVPTKDEEMRNEFLRLQPGVAKYYGGELDTLEILVFETATAVMTKGRKKETFVIY